MRTGLAKDSTGVTSPLGTALTIGIVILLAIGLSLMVRIFTDRQNEDAPPVTFSRDEASDALTVLHVEEGMFLSHLQIMIDVGGDMEVGQPPGAGDDALPAKVFVALGGAAGGPPDAELPAGTRIFLCVEPGPASDIHVEIRHVASNSLIYRTDFLSLPDCPE